MNKNIRTAAAIICFAVMAALMGGCGLKMLRENNIVEYTFVGDVLLYHWPAGRVYNAIQREKGWDAVVEYPFAKVREYFRGLVFCNHDGPISDRGARKFKDKDEKSYFQVSKKYAVILKKAGFTGAFLANNHIKDCGDKGVTETLANLKEAGVLPIGAGEDDSQARQPVIIEENGIKTAFLAYNLVPPFSVRAGKNTPGAAYADKKGIIEDIQKAKKSADIVAVNFHWGREMRQDWVMKKQDKAKVELARAAIDAGALMVVGEHSHAVEKIELYKNGIIAYSLGNFVFGASTRGGHKQSMILRVKAAPGGMVSYDVIPVMIYPKKAKYQPVPLEGAEKEAFMKKLENLSE